MTLLVDILFQGLLLGGLFALYAAGLALVFGVMRIVNLAHGDFIILAAFGALSVVQSVPVHPFLTLLIVAPVMAAFGYALQAGLLNRFVGNDTMAPLLVTFGVSIIIQNVLLQIFSGDTRKLQGGAIETASFSIGDSAIGVYPMLVFTVAVLVILALQYIFFRTSIGHVLRATADDPGTARLMGVSTGHVYAVASAIAFAVIAVVGVLMAVRTNFDPTTGPARLLTAFEVVIIGGLGSFWGALVGGVILGVSQSIGARIDPSYQVLAGHAVFLVVLLLRPDGLFPRVTHK